MAMQPMDREFHATYSGSMIHRLLAGCYGSVRLARTVPPAPDTEWQREGTAAHAELELRVFTGATRSENKGVQVVLDYLASLPGPRAVWSEQRVCFPQSVVPKQDCSGTLDLAATHARSAWIIDYKHGAGEFVAAEENTQLMFYAWAALHEMLDKVDDITLVIIQPNSWQGGDPIREYKTTALELFDFARRVEAAIVQAERLHAPLLPGEHCKFCPAAPVCTARERESLAVLTGAEPGTIREWQPADLPKPEALDLARLGQVVTKAGAIRSWLKSVEDYAEARALAGEIEVPGCKVVEAAPRRKWLNESAVIEGMLPLLVPHDSVCDEVRVMEQIAPHKLIGITEAEKLVVDAATRGLETVAEKRAAIAKAKEAFSALTTKESSGALSLVPLSDPRPPVNRAAKHFGGVHFVEIGE